MHIPLACAHMREVIESIALAKKPATPKNKDRGVVRDETFHRAVADKVIPIDLGRDIELSFLQVGPRLIGFSENAEFESFHGERVYSEVARIRVDVPTMVGLALQFIELGISRNKLHGEKIAETIAKWSEEANAAEKLGSES